MVKKPVGFLTIIISLLFSLTTHAQDLKLWDIRPATTWMTEAYPMGNGRIGGMVFGGITKEHIQFNELSLWTGDETNTGAYQAFGDLWIGFDGPDTADIEQTDMTIEH